MPPVLRLSGNLSRINSNTPLTTSISLSILITLILRGAFESSLNKYLK